MVTLPPVVEEFGNRLAEFRWVSDLLIAGSLATGDYMPGTSDLDLVALVAGPVDRARQVRLTTMHRHLDEGTGAGLNLGCVYVDAEKIQDVDMWHPTWTHGSLIQRALSRISRAELVRHGYAVVGRPPGDLFAAMTEDDVREAARAELTGPWAWAARRPWLWLDPQWADLGLTSMARGRYALANGELLTKSQAIRQANAPDWLIEQLAARRRGENVTSPRVRTALIAWRDARRTVGEAGAT